MDFFIGILFLLIFFFIVLLKVLIEDILDLHVKINDITYYVQQLYLRQCEKEEEE